MKWTTQAWKSIDSIYQQIVDMPFIEQLSNGTLPKEKFQFYMQQDAMYLADYGRALAALGARASSNEMALDFFEFGKHALVVESGLHESYFNEFGLSSSEPNRLEPVCHHYVHYLKSCVAFQPVEVAVAAVLPCFWIYKEVGDLIYSQAQHQNNPYQSWIDTYAGEDFAQGVRKAKAYCEQLAEQTTPKLRKEMLTAFQTASRLEYMFWDAAFRMYRWPVEEDVIP